jgi:hypothetical protein
MGEQRSGRDELGNFLDAFRMTVPGRPGDAIAKAMTGGDTISAAVSEKRCIKEPAGCGKGLLNPDGSPRFVYEGKDTADLYYREWLITGLCGDCQDAMEEAGKRAEAEALEDASTNHVYLSTVCLHGEHEYCRANTGAAGTKIPAVCKWCSAPCQCECHAG